MTRLFDKQPKPDYTPKGSFNLIQITKIVSPPDQPRPYRLIETYVTSEGMRSRICSGAYNTLGEDEFQRETLEKIVKAGGQK